MKVTGRTASGMSPLNTTRDSKTAKGQTAQAAASYGQVSLSPEARALHEIALIGNDEVRPDMVAEARAMLDSGTLDSDANIDKALDRLMVHVI